MRFELTKKPMLEAYPVLARYDPLKVKITGHNVDKIIRYVILLSDFDSPINEISDETDRRMEAAKMAGLDVKKKNVKTILELKGESITDEKVDNIFHCMFVILNNHHYESWYTSKKNYHEISKELRKDISQEEDKDSAMVASRRVTIQKALDELSQNLIQKQAILFPNSTARKVIERTASLLMVNWAEKYGESDTVE